MKKRIKKLVVLFLRLSATIQLKKYQAKIIGVTGSVGKTSTVKFCQAILVSRYKVLSLKEGYNSEIGVPLSILGQESGYNSLSGWVNSLKGVILTLLFRWEKYDYIILEMGVDKPGDMEYLLSFIKPGIGIVLNVYPVHAEAFSSFKKPLLAIGKEKMKLVESIPSEGTALLYSQPLVEKLSSKVVATKVLIKTTEAKNIKISRRGLEFELFENDKNFKLSFPHIYSDGLVNNLLFSFTLGKVCGLTLGESYVAIQNICLPPGRLSIIDGIKGTVIIDSSYNASPASMKVALKALSLFPKKSRVAVLGDMRELGEYGESYHKEIGYLVANIADRLVTVGSLSGKYLAPAAIKAGFTKDNLFSFDSVGKAISLIEDVIKPKDTILFKGSQNTIFLEKAVEFFMKDKKDAGKLLCRRGKLWDKKRAQY